MFATRGFVPWLGQGLVIQTVVGSLFLSYLLDFSTGWIYAVGIGVLGGTVQRQGVDAGLEPEKQPALRTRDASGSEVRPDRNASAGALQNYPG
jgi:hypothetical protein